MKGQQALQLLPWHPKDKYLLSQPGFGLGSLNCIYHTVPSVILLTGYQVVRLHFLNSLYNLFFLQDSASKMTPGGCCVLSAAGATPTRTADHAACWGLAAAHQKPLSIHIPDKRQHISNPLSEITISVSFPHKQVRFPPCFLTGVASWPCYGQHHPPC